VVLGLVQPVAGMSTRGISRGVQEDYLHVLIALKF
jgi:hypothetical protein